MILTHLVLFGFWTGAGGAVVEVRRTGGMLAAKHVRRSMRRGGR